MTQGWLAPGSLNPGLKYATPSALVFSIGAKLQATLRVGSRQVLDPNEIFLPACAA
jgi:hypothetical protein